MLTFYYGVMGSSKSLRLLIQRYDLEMLGKEVYAVKPETDTRSHSITSRVGLSYTPEYSFTQAVQRSLFSNNYLLVDEAQFLSSLRVRLLRSLADSGNKIYCYGLKTDFKGQLFEGSGRLLELADTIEEIPSICKYCTQKAIFNMRIDRNGKKITSGEVVQIGGDESYVGVCSSHYYTAEVAA